MKIQKKIVGGVGSGGGGGVGLRGVRLDVNEGLKFLCKIQKKFFFFFFFFLGGGGSGWWGQG